MKKRSKYIVSNYVFNNCTNNYNKYYITSKYVFSPEKSTENKNICQYCDNILKYSHCEYCNISYFITQEYYSQFIDDFFKTFAQNGFK